MGWGICFTSKKMIRYCKQKEDKLFGEKTEKNDLFRHFYYKTGWMKNQYMVGWEIGFLLVGQKWKKIMYPQYIQRLRIQFTCWLLCCLHPVIGSDSGCQTFLEENAMTACAGPSFFFGFRVLLV